MLRAGSAAGDRPGKASRVALFRELTASLVDGLGADDASAIQGIFKHLVSAETWLALRNDFGVDGATAGRAVSKAVRALAADLSQRRGALK
jgi:hypothetical protein